MQQQQAYQKEERPYVTIRTRFFDDFFLASILDVKQIVILACGMDTRAFRLSLPKDVKVYEIDQEEVIKAKNEILKDTSPVCQRYTIATDLTKPWSNKLLAEGYLQDLPSIWLLEGLLMYLNVEEVHQLLKTVSELSTTGSWIGLDLINEFAKEEPIDKEFKGYFRSGFDNPEELLANYGWQAEVFQPGDEGANFGRHPYKFPPNNVKHIGRAFLIKASKIQS